MSASASAAVASRTGPGAGAGLTRCGTVRGLVESELGHRVLHLLDPAGELGTHDPLRPFDEPVDHPWLPLLGRRKREPPCPDRRQVRGGLVVERHRGFQLARLDDRDAGPDDRRGQRDIELQADRREKRPDGPECEGERPQQPGPALELRRGPQVVVDLIVDPLRDVLVGRDRCELVAVDRRVGCRIEGQLADIGPHEPADGGADGFSELDLARHSPGPAMAVRSGTGAIAPDLALDGLGARTQEDPPGPRAPAPRGGRQGCDHDRQDEDRHVEEPLDERVLGQVPVLVEHGLSDDERRDGQPEQQCHQLRHVLVAPLFARRRRDDPLLPPRLAERFVHPKVARQHLFEVGRVRVDRYEGEVTLDDEGADRVARLRFRRRSGDCRELVGEATRPFDHDDPHLPFDGEKDLVDRVRPTASEDRHGGPRGRQLVKRFEEERRLAAPIVAVGEDEVGVVRLELRRPCGPVVFVALERDLACGRDAQVRRGGVACRDGLAEHRHDPGRRATVHDRRAGLGRGPYDTSFEEPLEATLHGRVERFRSPDDKQDWRGGGELERIDQRPDGQPRAGSNGPCDVPVIERDGERARASAGLRFHGASRSGSLGGSVALD